jgi:hypothetical protein
MLRWIFAVAIPIAAAQTLNFDFSPLAVNATSKTEVNLDRAAMDALKIDLKDAGPFAGIETVFVHTYEYAKAGDYPSGALEPLRKQIAADSRWSRIVQAHEAGENTDIYIQTRDGKLAGMIVIAEEPKEVTVVQIGGSVEMAKLQEVVKSAIQYDLEELQARK